MQTVVDNLLLNYEIFGTKNKDIVLILHGWKRNLKDWEGLASSISENHKVILLDLPGFGGSSNPTKPDFDTYDYADLVSKFIDKLGLKNVTLIGHSFGGKTGIVMASKNSKIKKLILVDPSGIISHSITRKIKITIFKIVKPLIYILPKKIKEKIVDLFSSDDYKNAGILKNSFKKIVTQDIREDAKKINIPTLIIWGDKDEQVPLSSSKILKSSIKNSYIRIVWGASHHPHLEKPQKFLEILNEYI